MWARRLLLTVVLFGLFAGGRSESPNIDDTVVDSFDPSEDTSTPDEQPSCNYMILSPVSMTGDSKRRMCILVEKCSEPVNVLSQLKFYDTTLDIADATNVTEYYACQQINLPKTSKADIAFLSLQIIGDNINMQSRKQIVIAEKRKACKAMLNKPIFKCNDPIIAKWVCYDQDLKQVNVIFRTFTFTDPLGNALIVVRDPPADHGVTTFTGEFSLNAREGHYRLTGEDDEGQTYSTYIQLQNYRLPTWDLSTQCPGPVSVTDKYAEITGSAQFSYGKPVQGIAQGKCCRNWPKYGQVANCFKGLPDLCQNYTVKLDENGDFKIPISLEDYKLMFSGPQNYISCEVNVIQYGTEEVKTSYCSAWITNRPVDIQLDHGRMEKYYNNGPIDFRARVTDHKNNPVPFQTITISFNGKNKKIQTDKDGKASCLIHVKDYHQPNLTLVATLQDPDLCYSPSYSDQQYVSAEATLFRYFSSSGSFIRMKVPDTEIPARSTFIVILEYRLTEKGCGKGVTQVTVLIIFKGKNGFENCIKTHIDVTQGYDGNIEVEAEVDERLSGNSQILAIALLDKDAISDTKGINVGLAFPNQMTLAFEKPIAEPGETVDQIITAEPFSLCCTVVKNAAFDQLAYNDFNAHTISYDLISYSWGLQYGDINLEEPDPPCVDPNKETFCNGGYYRPTSFYTDDDTYTQAKDNGIVLMSNVHYRRPQVCGEEKPTYILYKSGGGIAFAAAADAGVEGAPNTVTQTRSRLDDSLGIQNILIGDSGTERVPTQLGESIATWKGEGFCASLSKGIGLPFKWSTITTLKNLFGASEFPNTVIAGEEIYLVASAHNYMKQCATVEIGVLPAQDGAIEVTPLDNKQQQCACSGEIVFRTFLLKCNEIGSQSITTFAKSIKISDTCEGPHNSSMPNYEDILQQTIVVVPPGIPRNIYSGYLIRVNGSSSSVTISVPEPTNLQEGTWEVYATCTGDPAAISLKNLEQVMDLPPVCCEQQISILRYIGTLTNYLTFMGVMDSDTLMRAKKQMQRYYFDQLSCMIRPGLFSLYRSTPNADTLMSLTTFQTFNIIQKYVFVDEKVPREIVNYMASIQNLTTGCIEPQGRPFSSQDNEHYMIQVNAYAQVVLSSALEKYSGAALVFVGAKKCTEDVSFEELDTFTQVILLISYGATAQLAKLESGCAIVRVKLTSRDGILYLKDKNPLSGVYYGYNSLTCNELITTACFLKSLTYLSNPTQEQIDTMATLASTLHSQVNGRGAYPSTESTATVTDALTSYNMKYGSTTTQVDIKVSANGMQIANFDIEDRNKFVVYRQRLNPQSGNYTFEANGTGSALCQMTSSYYTKVSKGDDAAFVVTATTTAPECFNGIANRVDLNVVVSYVGANNECGPTIVAVRSLTGHYIEYNWEKWKGTISEVDMSSGEMAYFLIDRFGSDPVSWTVSMTKRDSVPTMQNATVVVTVLGTGESGSTDYGHPCRSYNLGDN